MRKELLVNLDLTKISTLISERSLTQTGLAERMKMHQSNLSRVMRKIAAGEPVTPRAAGRLARALKTTVGEISSHA